MKKEKRPLYFIITCLCVGIALGAYILGVEKLFVPISTGEDTGIITEIINISILHVFVGGLFGGVLGLLAGYVLSPLISKLVFRFYKKNEYGNKDNIAEDKRVSIQLTKLELLKRKLNFAKKSVIVIGIILLLFYFFFPPWEGCNLWIETPENETGGYPGSDYEPLGHHFFTSKEDLLRRLLYVDIKIDYHLHFKMCAVTTLVCGGIFCFLHAVTYGLGTTTKKFHPT